ncbi:MAG: HAMP domain-containing histidine kinase [Planctomycetes bacterium]|nr:HAMP domain-containing histidine kinase [Planctomycetota bacterium]
MHKKSVHSPCHPANSQPLGYFHRHGAIVVESAPVLAHLAPAPLKTRIAGNIITMSRGLAFQVLTPVILLLAGFLALLARLGASHYQQARAEALLRLKRLAAACAGVTIPRTPLVLEIMRDMSGAELVVCGPDGLPMADEAGLPLSTLPLAGPLPDTRAPANLDWPNRRWLASLVPLDRENRHFLAALVDRDPIDSAAREALLGTVVAGTAAGLPCLAMALWLASRMGGRLARLKRQTERIAQGDFAPIDIPSGTKELEDLGRAINAMAFRLRAHEDELRASERASLVGQLGAGVAHQVRNAATGARLAIQLHAKSAGEPIPEDLVVALRQLDLIELQSRQMMDLARPPRPDRKLVDPVGLVDDVVNLAGPKCRHAMITLDWQAPEKPSAPIVADAEALRMALLNIVMNAVEAAGPRGLVRVRLAPGESGSASFRVADNGQGPSPRLAGRLFQPFASTKREGIGLGLAVARRVARDHGGDVSWTREGDETVFTLTTKAPSP